jgi:hypothetical protein
MNWVGRGAAFGVGFFYLAPALFGIGLVIVFGIVTHLWFLGFLALCFLGGGIAGIVKFVQKEHAESQLTSLDWFGLHRRDKHAPGSIARCSACAWDRFNAGR